MLDTIASRAIYSNKATGRHFNGTLPSVWITECQLQGVYGMQVMQAGRNQSFGGQLLFLF
jgi:hypothetical protein